MLSKLNGRTFKPDSLNNKNIQFVTYAINKNKMQKFQLLESE